METQKLQNKLKFINRDRFIIPALFVVTLLRFRNLGHRLITYWDELFHAIVARNLTKHFLMPTLYENPYLPYDYKGWTVNHIWLHKPPIPLWQIAISYHILGVNAFALRLPSAILSILSVFITYLIGSELYDRKVGAVAAFLQAINPLMMGLVHGYIFTDHINIAVVFWVEVSCYLLLKALKTGKAKYYIWSGIAQGLGYLSKSYLCLVSFGIMVLMFILVKTGILKSQKENIGAKKMLLQTVFSILAAAPWVVLCLIKYTKEFIHENNMVLAHLYTQVEVWEKPWEHHLFHYMPPHYPYWYLIIFVSFIFLLVSAIRRRSFSDIFVTIWVVVVFVPLSMSTSKVPAGADIAVPALLICFAAIFFRMIREGRGVTMVAYFALIFSVFFLSKWPFHLFGGMQGTIVSNIQRIPALGKIAPSLHANAWIVYQFLCYLVAFAVFYFAYMGLRLWRKRYIGLMKILAVIMLIVLVYPLGRETVRVTHKKPLPDSLNSFENIGHYVKDKLPENSVFLLEAPTEYEHQYIMFFADRSAYYLNPGRENPKPPADEQQVTTIRNNGGIPYLVSATDYKYPVIYESRGNPNYRVYSLQ